MTAHNLNRAEIEDFLYREGACSTTVSGTSGSLSIRPRSNTGCRPGTTTINWSRIPSSISR